VRSHEQPGLAKNSTTGFQTAVASAYLLDTGIVVALANRADPDHARCVAVWKQLRGRLVTIEGVLVESMHLLRRAPGGAEAALSLVLGAGTSLVPPTEARMRAALSLMKKYRSVPMDFVDALLVSLAEETSIIDVLTLDRRGFETYRLSSKQRFTIAP